MINKNITAKYICISVLIKGIYGIFLRGKGGSFPYEVYKSWIPAYKAYRYSHVQLDMTYEAVGSGNGKAAIKENVNIEYAGSDTLLSSAEAISYPDLVTIPTMAGGVVLAYNIPNLNEQLHLTREHVVGIYNGTYKYWNETTFKVSNSNATMPNSEIIVIARADTSGTTSLFTSALSAFDENWNSIYGTFSRGLNPNTDQPYNWRNDIIKYYGQQNRGVAGLLVSFKNSIAYLSVADASESSLHSAIIMNKAGVYTQATSETIQYAMDIASESSNELTFSLTDVDGDNSYPIAGFTHFIMYKTLMSDCHSAKELLRYIDWFMTKTSQRQVCEEKGMTPLSQSMVQRITERVLKEVTCNGNNVWNMIQQDIALENVQEQTWLLPVAVTLPILFVSIVGLISYILFQKFKILKMANRNDWNIPIEDILFFYDKGNDDSQKSKFSGLKSLKSFTSFHHIPEGEDIVERILQWPGKWRGYQIGLRILELKDFKHITLEMKKCLIWMRENIVHTNIVRFYGLTEVDKDRYVIGEYCMKGVITNVLQDNKLNLSDDLKFCLANDIAFGMQFLHNQGIVHGNLRSSCCLIDSRWTVKISDWEYLKLSCFMNLKGGSVFVVKGMTLDSFNEHVASFEDFWVAPEIIKSDFKLRPNMDSDVYSYGIILQEVFTREDPYVEHSEYMSPSDIVRAVVNNNLRPEVTDDIPVTARQVMEIAWTDDPSLRPTFDQILKMFRRTRVKGKSVIDAMMESMEEYTRHLELRIDEQARELTMAKQNIDSLMTTFIPSSFVSKISKGEAIEAKVHKSLGIVVIEMAKSDNLDHAYSPLETFSYLNSLSSELDVLANKYSAFRDTVSGSFIIVIGLGDKKNSENEICTNIAHLCLDIVTKARSMEMFISTEFDLKLKLGVDIGSGISGVIGLTLPKFQVLGSVLDNALALARSSLPSKIHMSSRVWEQIIQNDEFKSEEAGVLSFQETTMRTYWLTMPTSGPTSVHEDAVPPESPDITVEKPKMFNTVACQTNQGNDEIEKVRKCVLDVHRQLSDLTEIVSISSSNSGNDETDVPPRTTSRSNHSKKLFYKKGKIHPIV